MPDVCNLLVTQYAVKLDALGPRALIGATISGNANVVDWICEQKQQRAQLELSDMKDPLAIATRFGKPSVVKALLERRADVNMTISSAEMKPLMMAAAG